MGFAAGMRAGQLAVEGAIDQYQEAKRNRQMREVEEQIQAAQQANAERQYGIRTQDATTGMTGAQQQQAVMPQAPSATGLSPEQLSAAVGIGTARQLPPVGLSELSNEELAAIGLPRPAPKVSSSAVGMTPEQVAGTMQEPRRGEQYTPMSQTAVERLRADKLRGLGYTEEADTALGRSLQLEKIDYQKQQDAIINARYDAEQAENKRRWEADFEYKRGRDEVADAQFDTSTQLAQDQLASLDDYRAALEANVTNQINLRNLNVQERQIPLMAQQAYTDSVLSGRNIMDVAGTAPEGFSEDPGLSALWATTVMGKFREETGMNDGQLATLYASVDNELTSIVNASYDDVPAQKGAFDSFIKKYVPDTNALDDYYPQLQEDPDNPGLFTLTNGPVNLNEQYLGSSEPRTLDEIGAAFKNKLKQSPSTYALSYVDSRQKALVRTAADLKEEEAAREFLTEAYKQNPGLFGDKQSVDSLLAMAGFDTGYDASAYTSGGAGGLQNVTPDKKPGAESAPRQGRQDISPVAESVGGFINEYGQYYPPAVIYRGYKAGLGTAADFIGDTAEVIRRDK